MPLAQLLLALLLSFAVVCDVSAERGGGKDRGGRQGLTAAQAGEIARGKTGGRVLAVTPRDGGYRVKVLTPGGEVRQVFVPGK